MATITRRRPTHKLHRSTDPHNNLGRSCDVTGEQGRWRVMDFTRDVFGTSWYVVAQSGRTLNVALNDMGNLY